MYLLDYDLDDDDYYYMKNSILPIVTLRYPEAFPFKFRDISIHEKASFRVFNIIESHRLA